MAKISYLMTMINIFIVSCSLLREEDADTDHLLKEKELWRDLYEVFPLRGDGRSNQETEVNDHGYRNSDVHQFIPHSNEDEQLKSDDKRSGINELRTFWNTGERKRNFGEKTKEEFPFKGNRPGDESFDIRKDNYDS